MASCNCQLARAIRRLQSSQSSAFARGAPAKSATAINITPGSSRANHVFAAFLGNAITVSTGGPGQALVVCVLRVETPYRGYCRGSRQNKSDQVLMSPGK